MQFNRQKKQNITIDKFKNISVGKKAFIYMFLMGIIGAAVGTVDSKIAIERCLNSERCTVENSAKIKLGKISMGTCAGMVAATFLSVPAILNEEN